MLSAQWVCKNVMDGSGHLLSLDLEMEAYMEDGRT